MICTYCQGKRLITLAPMKDYARGHIRSPATQAFISCPRCSGTGVEVEQPYYVIWMNLEKCQFELHKPLCEHELHAKPEDFHSIGGDHIDPVELAKDLYRQYKPYPVVVEECMR